MNFRSLRSGFCSTNFTPWPVGSVNHRSTCLHNRSTPLVTASRTSNDRRSDSGGSRGNSDGGDSQIDSQPSAAAEKGRFRGSEDSLNWLKPLLTSLGLSILLGLTSGVAFDITGRMVAVSIGIFFIFLQGLVSVGAVDLRWEAIEKRLDITGDGKFDEKDIKLIGSKIKRILAWGVLGAVGFAVGFLLGYWLGSGSGSGPGPGPGSGSLGFWSKPSSSRG